MESSGVEYGRFNAAKVGIPKNQGRELFSIDTRKGHFSHWNNTPDGIGMSMVAL